MSSAAPHPPRASHPPGRHTDPPPIDDLQLARQAGLGDRDAFAEIFHRHAAGLYRYATNMLDGDAHEAEDAVQDALTRAWINLPTFRGDAALSTWLFTITANTVLQARRRRRPHAVDDGLLDSVAGLAPDPHDDVEHDELRLALTAALSELPWRQRATWLLREQEELSYQDIADILGTTPTVVRGQLHRARATLAVRMIQWR